jgi:hypothetical protein
MQDQLQISVVRYWNKTKGDLTTINLSLNVDLYIWTRTCSILLPTSWCGIAKNGAEVTVWSVQSGTTPIRTTETQGTLKERITNQVNGLLSGRWYMWHASASKTLALLSQKQCWNIQSPGLNSCRVRSLVVFRGIVILAMMMIIDTINCF